jgi:hypothetical protein
MNKRVKSLPQGYGIVTPHPEMVNQERDQMPDADSSALATVSGASDQLPEQLLHHY